jgi:hypothetical protein
LSAHPYTGSEPGVNHSVTPSALFARAEWQDISLATVSICYDHDHGQATALLCIVLRQLLPQPQPNLQPCTHASGLQLAANEWLPSADSAKASNNSWKEELRHWLGMATGSHRQPPHTTDVIHNDMVQLRSISNLPKVDWQATDTHSKAPCVASIMLITLTVDGWCVFCQFFFLVSQALN